MRAVKPTGDVKSISMIVMIEVNTVPRSSGPKVKGQQASRVWIPPLLVRPVLETARFALLLWAQSRHPTLSAGC